MRVVSATYQGLAEMVQPKPLRNQEFEVEQIIRVM
jgi:hypothetical protein